MAKHADKLVLESSNEKMLEAIEKLLILQDRDRNIQRIKTELAHIEPERQMLSARAAGTQASLDSAKNRGKQIESDRKKLELEVEAQKQQIEKYSMQQFQTKKNEEYRALAHEIETCKANIFRLEDQQIDLMEKAEAAQKDVHAATQGVNEGRKLADGQIADLGVREKNLKKELAELEANRGELLGAVDEIARSRYERLLKSKGGNVVVGVQHGVCGGCHMKLPTAVIVACQAQSELVTCINCGRILYYTRDMDLAAVD
ncbi:MAG TPA: C4-type zinc ribbon domain-containing protein [Verrucomicrobiae bacterium]|nr:C4-type zinc ribbon domain-containing protein [Verrucomicrobiae bacterium]